MLCTTATTALLAASTIALAQARYEIGYQFDDEPEVVRAESEPFAVSELWRPASGGATQSIFIDQARVFTLTPTLNYMVGQVIAGPEPEDFRSQRVWSTMTFDDLLFRSDVAEDIVVDLNMIQGGLVISRPSGAEYDGIEYRYELAVTVNGQTFTGDTTVTLTGLDDYVVERTGILADSDGRSFVLRGITVPTNRRVELTIESRKSVQRPAGSTGNRMSFRSAEPDPGFPAENVFLMPDGVRVDSIQANIINNRWPACPADLNVDGEVTIHDFLFFQNLFDAGDPLADFDLDGELTIFDFLAFQNAFDAGCP